VRLKRGLFPDTAAGLESETFAVVHLDGDLYETTRAGLDFFWPRMVTGGVIVLDDYGLHDCPGVTRAVDELGVSFEQTARYQVAITRG